MRSVRPNRLAASLLAAVVLGGPAVLVPGPAPAAVPALAPTLRWTRTLPGVTVRMSSPTPAVLDGGGLSILFGGRDGRVHALHARDGSTVPGWPAATSHPIDSTPSVADVDADGAPEVFVGSGTGAGPQCSGGAVYSFTADGRTRFRFQGSDPDCPNQAVHSTPAIGDITASGAPDVTVGALGLTMYSLGANGSLNPGWPFYSDDTVFSSPALADVNGDGVTDVVVGGDSSPGGPTDHRGGLVRAIDGRGRLLWQFLTDDIVFSSPAVGDVDGDGEPEIVFGTGDYWQRTCGCARDSTRVFALDRAGRLKPGWPVEAGGRTMSSPALADVTGDGVLDVVEGTAGADAGAVVAWRGNGQRIWSIPQPGGVVIGSVTTADLTGTGAQDVLVPTGAGVWAFNGRTGAELFSLNVGRIAYQNSPLVAEVDGRTALFLVGTTPGGDAVVQRWDLAAPARPGALGWPMFHKDPRHTGSWTNPPLTLAPTGLGRDGYWMASADGAVLGYGSARVYGSMAGARLNSPIVGLAPTPTGRGYWLVAADGGIFSFGDAGFHGSTGAIRLNKPIVGITPTPSGRGYWLVARDGGIFAFGDAGFHGSTGAIRLNQPIVGMGATFSGRGYWLAAADGGIFAFGDARFHGSAGGSRLGAPVIALSSVLT